ncbi:MAG: hypothetical protein B7Y69_08290 [Sphingobacteriia bacterium 35-40-8]|nr:MAG: hypothetical protein B7Y69_08290 [Sphingobacteriia bacterium 35-40-8]HQS38320.1 hypothetical protein [Methylotenera sp.]
MNENFISLQDAAEGLAGGVKSESEMWLSLLISDAQEGKLACLKSWIEHRGTSPGGISFDRQPHEWRVLRVTLKTWMEARAIRQAFGYREQGKEHQPAPVVPQPQPTTPSPAPVVPTEPPAPPVVAAGASGGVEPDKAGPLPVEQGLSTKDIAHAFDGVNGWSVDRWTKNLSAAKWLHPARIALGGAGGASSVWSPVMLAQLMHDSTKGEREKEKLMKVFNSRFARNPALGLWRDAFNDYFATHCATD